MIWNERKLLCLLTVFFSSQFCTLGKGGLLYVLLWKTLLLMHQNFLHRYLRVRSSLKGQVFTVFIENIFFSEGAMSPLFYSHLTEL